VTTSLLSPGIHGIRFTVTDSDGAESHQEIQIVNSSEWADTKVEVGQVQADLAQKDAQLLACQAELSTLRLALVDAETARADCEADLEEILRLLELYKKDRKHESNHGVTTTGVAAIELILANTGNRKNWDRRGDQGDSDSDSN
jgi:hypothetical protein